MSGHEGAASAAPPTGVGGRFKAFRERYHLAFEIAFFFAGFLFDVVLLHRIDSRPLLIHQATYLVLAAALVFWDHRIHVAGTEPEGFVGKVAAYRLWVMHFFLGTLLNAFMVFYFRASSGVAAFVFLVALAAIIVANELPQFRSRGPIVRVMLLSFVVTSFMAYLLPVLWGELRTWQYLLSVALGTGATFGLWKLFRRYTHDPNWTFKRAVMPGLIIQAALLTLYFAKVIPPVPLSLKSIGVYYSVQRTTDEKGVHYALKYAPAPGWKFWQKRSDTLVLKEAESDEGREKVMVFMRIFAPMKFRDAIICQWDYDDPVKGWREHGAPYALPSGISGGSEEGWHTFASMTARKAGTFRLRVLTADGREIGRKTFEVVLSPDVSERVMGDEVG